MSRADRRFILALALWTGLLATGANLLAGYGLHHWRWLERRLEMPPYEIAANLQYYQVNYRRCPIVVLGSSVVGGLPPPGWERPGICSITLVGQGALLGLEVMARLTAAPRVLFVEASFGFRDAPPIYLDPATDPWPEAIRGWLPLTRASANWVNMLGKSLYDVPPALWRPSDDWSAWRAAHKQYSDVYLSIYGNPVNDWGQHHLDDNLARTRTLVAALESRGTQVIFFDAPLDPDIAALPIIALWEEKMHAAFPDHEWVSDSPENYRLTDGMHFASGSGEDFFELLLSHLPEGAMAGSAP